MRRKDITNSKKPSWNNVLVSLMGGFSLVAAVAVTGCAGNPAIVPPENSPSFSAASGDKQRAAEIFSVMEETPLGRQMRQAAAERGTALVFVNAARLKNGMKSSSHGSPRALYLSERNMIALTDGLPPPVDPAVMTTLPPSLQKFLRAQPYLEDTYHEFIHLLQHKIWNTLFPPSGTRPLDDYLWKIAVEAQAKLVGTLGVAANMKLHPELSLSYPDGDLQTLTDLAYSDASPDTWDSGDLLAVFENLVAKDTGHADQYRFVLEECERGGALRAEDFVAAFGTLPGRRENFMAGRIRDMKDVYEIFRKNPVIEEALRSSPGSLPPLSCRKTALG